MFLGLIFVNIKKLVLFTRIVVKSMASGIRLSECSVSLSPIYSCYESNFFCFLVFSSLKYILVELLSELTELMACERLSNSVLHTLSVQYVLAAMVIIIVIITLLKMY